MLETQVVNIEQDIANLDEDVDFLFDETVIQDERLLNLEEETSVINEEVEGMLVVNVSYFKLILSANHSLVHSSNY